MDPNQHRLALDFQLDGRKYAYRSGDAEPIPEAGCSLQEATQALGCRHSVMTTVEVKREIGAIWADPQSSPYTDIFPPDLSATTLWRSVRIMRAVDTFLQAPRNAREDEPRKAMVATHLNRIILHLVLNDKAVSDWLEDYGAPDDLPETVSQKAKAAFEAVLSYIEKDFPNAYLSSFTKNTEKCQALVASVTGNSPSKPKIPDQMELFAAAAEDVGADQSADALDKAFEKIDTRRTN